MSKNSTSFTFPQILTFVLFALFVQTVVSNKFIGHGIVIGIFVISPILYNFGLENTHSISSAVHRLIPIPT
jgi:hypothetical protein